MAIIGRGWRRDANRGSRGASLGMMCMSIELDVAVNEVMPQFCDAAKETMYPVVT